MNFRELFGKFIMTAFDISNLLNLIEHNITWPSGAGGFLFIALRSHLAPAPIPNILLINKKTFFWNYLKFIRTNSGPFRFNCANNRFPNYIFDILSDHNRFEFWALMKQFNFAIIIPSSELVSISSTLNARILRTNVLLYVRQSRNVTRKSFVKHLCTKNSCF